MEVTHPLQIVKKGIVLCLTLFITISLVLQPAMAAKSKAKAKVKPQPKKPAVLTYIDPNYKVSFSYPLAWEKVPGYKQTIVIFGSPLESKSDLFRENVTVTTDILPGQTTLKQYTDQHLARIRTIQPEFKLAQTATTKVAGYPAYRAVYASKYGVYQVKVLQVFTMVKNRTYVLTYTAQPDKYDKFLGQAAQIIQSVKFVK